MMRIWVQSNTALRSDSAWSRYTEALELHLGAVKEETTELRIEGVEKMEHRVESSAFDRHVNVRQVIQCGINAEREGFDAFVMVGLGTAGYEELRDVLRIPVVYAEAVAWNLGRWQFGRFGLIGHEPTVYFRRIEQIRAHGSLGFFVPGDYCDLSVREVLAAFADPGKTIAAVEASTRRAARDGAQVLIPDFNVLNDLLFAANVRTLHGVPVMDVSGLSLKATEFLVGVRRRQLL